MQSKTPPTKQTAQQSDVDLRQGSIVASPDVGACLDTDQLARLEHSFRQWMDASPRRDTRLSRRRILLVFLLIRYTGAKLNEILALDPFADIDEQSVCIRGVDSTEHCLRRITIAKDLSQEIRATLEDRDFRDSLTNQFSVDPAFVRRKFYERAEACGFAKHLSGPEMIRRARAVELMQSNMPLPAVQKLLGHATPNQTMAYVSFSEEELHRVTKRFMERESVRKTSARNAFFGKIVAIQRGDIQARIVLVNHGGYQVTTLITNESVERLGLRLGGLVTAEVKAPWIMLQQGETASTCSADNRFFGKVVRIHKGKVSSEYLVRIDDGTELCAVLSTSTGNALGLKTGNAVWALFSCFAVTLRAD